MVGITVYVEGGGDRREQQARLRRAFSEFIGKAGLVSRMPRVVLCGGRDQAYDYFRIAHKINTRTVLLLVDSEGPVTAESAWLHLKTRDRWERPLGASNDQCHLMVQLMESWFLADLAVLAEYYGSGFRVNVIPQRSDIEEVPKSDVSDKLEQATRGTSKGRYHKGRHSFELLRRIDPAKVMDASPYAKRFVNSLKQFSSSS